MWFAVHVLTGFFEADASRKEVVVEENVYLVECDSLFEAERQAELLAKQSARSQVSYLHPRRTLIENLGVRKVLEISNPELGNVETPRHGTEVTYEVMRFDSRDDVERYRQNESISAQFWKPPLE